MFEHETKWRVNMIYGSFSEPTTKKNFFIIRVPEGRVQWSKKIAPAITRLVRSWYTDEDRKRDAYNRKMLRDPVIYWKAEGDNPNEKSFWALEQAVARYEWNGSALITVD
jgi:hypothetical protein